MRKCKIALIGMLSFLLLVSGAPLNVSGHNYFNKYYDPDWGYFTQSDLTLEILDFQNTTIFGLPLLVDDETGDVYYTSSQNWTDWCVWRRATNTTEVLNASLGWNPDSPNFEKNFYALECDDGSFLLSVRNKKAVYRSTDEGRTWTQVHTTEDGQPWQMAKRGAYVYAAEYAVPPSGQGANIWMSTDNGKAGTWSKVYETAKYESGTGYHWHGVFVDPYTNYVYACWGDVNNTVVYSTNGVNFTPFVSLRITAVVANEHNLYFGADPPGIVYIYNKTTHEWTSTYLHKFVNYGPIYRFLVNDENVLYARTLAEGVVETSPYYRTAGIWISPDGGASWHFVLNMTGTISSTTADNTWYDQSLFRDGQGRIVFGYQQPTSNVADRCKVWIWTMRDLSRAEAYAIAGHSPDDIDSDDYEYENWHLGVDGENNYIPLGTVALKNPKLTITNYQVRNLFKNGSFPHPWIMPTYWGAGVAKSAASGENNNLTLTMENTIVHSPPYSIKVQGLNSSALHGYISAKWAVDSTRYVPAETTITASIYYLVRTTRTDLDANTTGPQWSGNARGKVIFGMTDASEYSVNIVQNIDSNIPNQIFAYSRPRNNNTDEWQRGMVSFVVPTGKTMSYFGFIWEITGIIELYFDDCMVQVGPATPALENTEGYNTKNSTSVSFKLNSQTYNVGDLDAGETVEYTIPGVLSGLIPYEISVGGSRAITWNLSGEKILSVDHALVRYLSGSIASAHRYGTAMLKVWQYYPIDAKSFIGHSGSKLWIGFESDNPVNVSFSTSTFGWNAVSVTIHSLTGEVEIYVLGEHSEYTIYQNGSVILRTDGPVISFSTTENTTFEIVEGYPISVNAMIGIIVMLIGIGIMLIVVAYFVVPLAKAAKTGEKIPYEKWVMHIIHTVIIIGIGITLYVMLYEMFVA